MRTMTDEWIRLALTVSAPVIVGWIGWVITAIIRLRMDLAALKLHVSENYPSNKAMDEVKQKLDDVVKTLYRIAGQLGVSNKGD